MINYSYRDKYLEEPTMKKLYSCNRVINTIVITMLSILILMGCNQDNAYEQAMHEVEQAISDKGFDQAHIYLSEALSKSSDDKEVNIYQYQLNKYRQSIKLTENKKYDDALIVLNEVIDEVNGSHTLINYAKEDKQDVLNHIQNDDTDEVFPDVEVALDEPKTDLWSAEQAEELSKYMVLWGHQMNQTYDEYNQKESVDFYGINIPRVILDGTWKMAVDNHPVDIEWSTSGIGEATYQLLAVYSDADYQPNFNKHVHFFVLVNNEPKVYVIQQNQDNDKNYLYVNETQNTDLSQAFYRIVKQSDY